MSEQQEVQKATSTFGSREKETKNQVRYTTGWGVVYIPKTQLEKLGNPENIKLTVEAHEG